MRQAEDITGRRYGKLVAIKRAEKIHGRTAWECKCDCGNMHIVTTKQLKAGKCKSCGCLKREKKRGMADITGLKVGRLTALFPTEERAVNGSIYTDLSYDLSGMLFNNDITKSDEPENPDTPTTEDNAFKLTKTNVDGDQDQEFKFTVDLTAPDLAGVDKTKTITVKVYDANGKVVADKGTTFTYGGTNTISLKGGETAVFGQMYNSTKIKVTEEGTPSYLPSYAGTYGDSTKKTVSAGASLDVTGITEAKTDHVDYTNTYQSITPTGIIMNNLPFFMMIMLGAVAVVAAFVFQARRRVTRK